MYMKHLDLDSVGGVTVQKLCVHVHGALFHNNDVNVLRIP